MGRGGAKAAATLWRDRIVPAAFLVMLVMAVPYARPVFLRFQQQIEATSTFKQRKVELQKQGFNPSVVEDPIYVRDAETGGYSALTPERYEAICSGSTKL